MWNIHKYIAGYHTEGGNCGSGDWLNMPPLSLLRLWASIALDTL